MYTNFKTFSLKILGIRNLVRNVSSYTSVKVNLVNSTDLMTENFRKVH